MAKNNETHGHADLLEVLGLVVLHKHHSKGIGLTAHIETNKS